MRKLLLITLILCLVLSTALTTQAQDGGDCDPDAVQAWIRERQTWRQASQDVLDAQGVSAQSAMYQLADHLRRIEDLG